MSHSLHKVWIHAIWSVKDRQALIHPSIESQVHDYMRSQLSDLGCYVFAINGMPDHVHCLFLLNPLKALADVVKQVKGATSHWINANDIIPGKFAWQTGYAAYSVSESGMKQAQQYIRDQKQHHHKKSFMEEYEGFMKAYKAQANG